MTKGDSSDAKKHQCFFNADEDKDLHKALVDVKREFEQFDDLLHGDSIHFRSARWKVLFSDNFLKSCKNLKSITIKKSVIERLFKLSQGWRPKKRSSDPVCGSSSKIIKQFKVEDLYIVCANDIGKEWSDVVKELRYYQVLKVWDILPAGEIPKLIERLDNMFGKYTDDFLNRCKKKSLEGDLEVPESWSTSFDIVRFRNVANSENESDLVGCASDGGSYLENAKVSESLMLMKFYSFSFGVVGQLFSNKDSGELDLLFEVTDEEQEIIVFPRSAFILGRSGTGKTTVLTRKLLEKEKVLQMATELFYGVKSDNVVHSQENEVEETLGETERTILHQLFVTVSHKLCYAVKLQVTQHVSQLKSSICDGDCSKGTSLKDIDDFDDAVQFKDIPDSFVSVPTRSYPLVITFHKFLMMLDGTVGNSYFERFHEVRKLDPGRVGGRSIALETFIKLKEVNYERFSLSYWPHFNAKLIRKLDSSRVFTEIISHIKGGPQAVEEGDGKLSRDNYLLLSNSRVSSLSRQEREIIYELFQNYEKMKMKRGEFDLADLVIDLHRRLRIGSYTGDKFDFVYVDEVQDLTLSQIALFKYICKNVEEGFVFSGDTAQTIARGIDFRFQDIRSLFYKKFLLESKSCGHDKREEKGIMSKIFHLSQNFRTHDGVLKLAQSVIELLYRFFPQSIDVLEPENSLVYGEAPILLESGSNENAIITIFGKSGASIVGFGAEQVILVRDDSARKEVAKYVGKQALVLTIVECKGLEFQDVLLYNFFGSSPLQNKWRIIYEYMKEYDLLDSTSPSTFSTKHNVLCSELKQLYVAVTRTRQRLWICENTEEFCKPMFDYWKKKHLVQVRQLDYLLAQAMQVASSSEEWRSRGMKLYHDCNYEIATMCFARAGDTYWERRSKAIGLRATADRMRHLNPEAANGILREAADIFEAIGKDDSAAYCFCELGEYERAGKLYLEKCGESELEKAGECFSLAGCYELAADVYARGYFFPKCLKVCSKGKLFDKGLEYIRYWKKDATMDFGMVRTGKVIEKLEREFLEGCAHHYYKRKDHKSMMRFVKGFHSVELMREFLKRLGCFDELLLLEEELGNFLEAANIVKLRGEILKVSDLLGKAGNFKEASMLILLFVLSSSLWTVGSKGWPLKQFTKKQELLEKAKSFAKNESNNFYACVCTEADVLSNEKNSVSVMKNSLNSSQRHKSAYGEIISARKIIDAHLHTNSSKYMWEDYFVFDRIKHSDNMISENQISVETLVYFWNFWKDHVLNIFKYLRSLETQDFNEYKQYGYFCLNYMGVWRQFRELNVIYLLLNPGADWVRDLDNRFLHQNGKLVSIHVHHLASTARSYWSSEILSVGVQVLKHLEALYNLSLQNNLSIFCQSRSLTHIYEVAKSLLDCEYPDDKVLKRFVKFFAESFFGYVFPLDWQKSFAENMFSLRGSEVSKNLLQQAILENISSRGKLTYGKIGRVVMIILGLGKLNNDLYEKILKLFDGIDGNPAWKTFIQNLCRNVDISFPHTTVPENISKSPREWSLLFRFHEALNDTYNANWMKENDYISPGCFLYLVECLLILASSFHGYFITSKSSFVEWFIYKEVDNYPNSTFVSEVQPFLGGIYESIINFVQQLLFNKKETLEWIRRSNINAKDYYPLLVFRSVAIICLVYLNSGSFLDSLSELLGRSYIIEHLPSEFYDVLRRRRKHLHLNVNVLAEAFKKVHNPLVIVRLEKNCSQFLCPDAIFVDMMEKPSWEDMLRVLHLQAVEASRCQIGAIEMGATNYCGEVLSLDSYDHEDYKLAPSNLAVQGDLNNMIGIKLAINYGYIWDGFEALKRLQIGGDPRCILKNDQAMKVYLGEYIHLLSIVMHECCRMNIYHEHENLFKEVASMLEELNLLSVALDARELQPGNNISTIGEVSKRLQSRRQHVEHFLNQFFLQLGIIHPVETLLGRSNISEQLPSELYDVFRRRGKHLHMNVNVLAEAFKKVHNPPTIVSLGKNCSQFLYPDSIFVDMTAKQSWEDMSRVLRLPAVEASRGQIGAIEVGATNSCGEVLSLDSYDHGGYKLAPSNLTGQGDLNKIIGIKLAIHYSYIWDRFEALKPLEIGGDPRCILKNDQAMKVNLGEYINLLSIIMRECRQMNIYHEHKNLLKEVATMLEELNLLSFALDVREPQPRNNISTIGKHSKRLQSRRQHVKTFLNQLFFHLSIIHLVETLLGRSYITKQLPSEFYDVFRRRGKPLHMNVNVLAEAFRKVHNPLVIVSLRKNCSQFLCPDAIFVDMTAKQSWENMLRVLCLWTVEASRGQIGAIEVGATNACGEVLSLNSHDQWGYKLASSNLAGQGDLNSIIRIKLPINYSYFWDIFKALKPLEIGGDPRCMLENDQEMNVNLGEFIHLKSIIMRECRQMNIYHEHENLLKEVAGMLKELNLLFVALDARESRPESNISTIGKLYKRLQSRRQHVEPFLNQNQICNQSRVEQHQHTNFNSKISSKGLGSFGGIENLSETQIASTSDKTSWRNISKLLIFGGAVVLACNLDWGVLTKAIISSVARRFANSRNGS